MPTIINDETWEYILESTITECNRVLHNWKLNEKPIGYNDKLSLFRSYLAEFFKQKFGFGAYKRYVRAYSPMVVIEDYLVIDIDFGARNHSNVYLDSLDRYARKMDILKFSQLQDLSPKRYDDPKIDPLKVVDYEKILKINFI